MNIPSFESKHITKETLRSNTKNHKQPVRSFARRMGTTTKT